MLLNVVPRSCEVRIWDWERVGILTRQMYKAKTGGGRHDLPTTISYGLVVDLVKNFKANHDHNNNKNETTTCKTKR